jgi:hypothetical protein
MALNDTQMLRPGDPGFDDELAGFQTAYRHRPALIVVARSAEDVAAAVRHAAAHELPVAVQATGHGMLAAVEGGMLITVGRMNGVEVDPEARTARVEAGTTWEAVVDAAGKHGLAPLSGSAPGVGVVGYTLGGGLGLLSRRYGYAADHVRALDVVTADAARRHVTAETDAELFWALRGAGAGLAVVTGMEIDLVPVARIYGGGLFFDTDRVPDLLRAYLDWTAGVPGVPDALTSSVGLIPFPDVDGVPAPLRGRYVAHVRIVFDGPAAEGERLVAPLRAVGPRLIDTLDELPFTDSASIYNDPPWPHAYSGTNAMLGDLDPTAIPALLELAGSGAPMMCVMQLNHLGGALTRPPEVPAAVEHRDARYLLRVLSPLDGTDIASVRAVHRGVQDVLAPWTLGRSPNFLFGEGGAADRAVADPDVHRRLAALKAALDPAGLLPALPPLG